MTANNRAKRKLTKKSGVFKRLDERQLRRVLIRMFAWQPVDLSKHINVSIDLATNDSIPCEVSEVRDELSREIKSLFLSSPKIQDPNTGSPILQKAFEKVISESGLFEVVDAQIH